MDDTKLHEEFPDDEPEDAPTSTPRIHWQTGIDVIQSREERAKVEVWRRIAEELAGLREEVAGVREELGEIVERTPLERLGGGG